MKESRMYRIPWFDLVLTIRWSLFVLCVLQNVKYVLLLYVFSLLTLISLTFVFEWMVSLHQQF